MNASESEVRDRSLAVVRQIEEQRERALVDQVFTAAAKGRGGAIRLADTLGAAHEGRIQTLVIARHYHEAGYRCQNCGYITDQALEVCPFCGGEIAEIAERIGGFFKRQVTVERSIDPAIIGGFILQGDGKLIDLSVRGQIGRILTKMQRKQADLSGT